MKVNNLILKFIFILCATGAFAACSNMASSDISEARENLGDLEQFGETTKFGSLNDLIPEGMSIEDVAPTKFYVEGQESLLMSSMTTSSAESYTLELLPVPERTIRGLPQGFNNNGTVLYSVFGSGFSGFYLNNSSEDTLAIYEGRLPYQDFFIGDLNDNDEAVLRGLGIEDGISYYASFGWSEATGLNRVTPLVDRSSVYSNQITNNSTIFGIVGARNNEGTPYMIMYSSDILGNSVNYSGQVGHDPLDYKLCLTGCLVANDQDEVVFQEFQRDQVGGNIVNRRIGLVSPSGNLEYYPVTAEEIQNGVPFMSQLYDMNDDVQVVGLAIEFGTGTYPALWKSGEITALPYPDNYGIIQATSINNSGFIAGYGFNNETGTFDIVLWSPDLQFQALIPDNADLYGGYPIINDHNEIVLTALIDVNGTSVFSPAKLTKQAGDTTPPAIAFDQLEQSLWPVDHKLKLVVSGIIASDDQDPDPTVEITVSSSESLNGTGDGNTDSDWEIRENNDGSFNIYLRAERDGANTGRTYMIEITATDSTGNTSKESVSVSVSHDRSGYSRE